MDSTHSRTPIRCLRYLFHASMPSDRGLEGPSEPFQWLLRSGIQDPAKIDCHLSKILLNLDSARQSFELDPELASYLARHVPPHIPGDLIFPHIASVREVHCDVLGAGPSNQTL